MLKKTKAKETEKSCSTIKNKLNRKARFHKPLGRNLAGKLKNEAGIGNF